YQVRVKQIVQFEPLSNARASLIKIGVNPTELFLKPREIEKIRRLYEQTIIGLSKDPRDLWPSNYRTDDGHRVRSKNEVIVDNWLYRKDICHAYERMVPGSNTISDFYIPKIDCFIEIWGMEDKRYVKRKEQKRKLYHSKKLNLIDLSEDDIKRLDYSLSAKLIQYGLQAK
ncbi:MAG: hypothetical protein L6M37_03580, partial [Candidatus Methylarchaceae archaeon HK02M1]|nr:hypothetical protein [Candidatus Methylarchaceae archaeon HK02M1]